MADKEPEVQEQTTADEKVVKKYKDAGVIVNSKCKYIFPQKKKKEKNSTRQRIKSICDFCQLPSRISVTEYMICVSRKVINLF
jgi:hypothetical protein